jgi:hypothetical protein
MDDAALRVKTSGLKALVRIRTSRERRALLDLQQALADRNTAGAARDDAETVHASKETLRSAREAEVYGALRTAGSQTAHSVLDRHLSIGRWTEAVDEAAVHLEKAQSRLDQADEAATEARARYAVRARAVRKWTRIEALVAGANARRDEAAREQESEDDVMSRRRGATSGSVRTR